MKEKKIIKICFINIFISIFILSTTLSAFGVAKVLPRPVISAKGAIVYCENNGDILYSKNKNTRIDPLSTTKLLTALIAVQNLDLDKEITIDKKTAEVGESTIYLAKGEKIKVKDLLYATLLRSANDAAYALGIAVSGSMKEFSKLMNTTAKSLGATNSNFVNPHGLKEEKHFSTPYDMMQIGRAAFSNETIKNIVSTYEYTIPKTNKSDKRTIYNYSHKFKYEGVFGGKTGTWDDQNCGIVVGYDNAGLKLCAVVLGDTTLERSNDMKKILDYSLSKIKGVPVIDKGKVMGTAKVKKGAVKTVEGYTVDEGIAYLPKEASKSLINTKIKFDNLKAPIKAGDKIGVVEIYLAEDLVNTVDLAAKQSVEKGWFTSYIGLSNKSALVVFLIFGFLLITMTVVLCLRIHNIKVRRKLREKRIMELAIERERKEAEYRMRDWRF